VARHARKGARPATGTKLQFANAPSSKTASAAVESRHLVAGAFSHVVINDNGDAFFLCKSASVVFCIAVYVSIQSNLCFVARHRTHHITDHQSDTKNMVNWLCSATWAAKRNTCRNRDSENEQRFQMAPGFAKTCFAYM
jgi:hypothetical protein